MYKTQIIGIYCIKNLINKKMYIGQSKNVKSRFSHHKGELRNNKHQNKYLQNDWNEYGENNFIFEILEMCSEELLDEKEIYYINLYATRERTNGYNLQSGGKEHPYNLKESIEKSRNSLLQYYSIPENKQKHSEQAYKQWANPDIKSKICGENNGMYGKTHTQEAKDKISKAQKGHISPLRNLTPVLCVELNQQYSCAAEASKIFGVQSGGILGVCRGIRKTYGGYHWKFIM